MKLQLVKFRFKFETKSHGGGRKHDISIGWFLAEQCGLLIQPIPFDDFRTLVMKFLFHFKFAMW